MVYAAAGRPTARHAKVRATPTATPSSSTSTPTWRCSRRPV